jgi:hypothetical protein
MTSLAEMPSQKIEQREKKNPNDVDKVPVKTAHFDRRVIIGGERAEPRFPKKPRHQTKTDDHMKRVQPGHREINPVKNTHLIAEFIGVDLPVREIADFFGFGQIIFLAAPVREARVRPKEITRRIDVFVFDVSARVLASPLVPSVCRGTRRIERLFLLRIASCGILSAVLPLCLRFLNSSP